METEGPQLPPTLNVCFPPRLRMETIPLVSLPELLPVSLHDQWLPGSSCNFQGLPGWSCLQAAGLTPVQGWAVLHSMSITDPERFWPALLKHLAIHFDVPFTRCASLGELGVAHIGPNTGKLVQ